MTATSTTTGPHAPGGAGSAPVFPHGAGSAPTSPHAGSLPIYLAVFAALLAGTALTVYVSTLDLGPANLLLALAIAGLKALLVALYFMHLKDESHRTWLFAGAGLYWLLILVALTFADTDTRHWLPMPGPGP
jgi:cytochrome c oxidase subunit 4